MASSSRPIAPQTRLLTPRASLGDSDGAILWVPSPCEILQRGDHSLSVPLSACDRDHGAAARNCDRIDTQPPSALATFPTNMVGFKTRKIPLRNHTEKFSLPWITHFGRA